MSGWYSWFFLTLYLTDNLLLSMSFIAFMMSAGRIINAVTEFLSGFIIDQTHTKIGKARPWILGTSFFVALPVNMTLRLQIMALHNLLSPCLLKDADMQSFLWSVAFC